jgi:BirA family biotin operon repressor/biotin-[acetyl-CoA-carboxylase] ligase
MLNQIIIEDKLADLPLGNIIFREEVGSTNDLAASLLNEGLPDASLIIANHQTQGRGRSDRKWFTPPDSALALSLVFTKFLPQLNDISIPLFTGLGALAVCKALEEDHFLQPQIKWPNDVLLEGKKTCGVLAEAHWEGNQLQAVIIGIGVNISHPSVPADENLNFPATCVQYHTNKSVDRLKILRTVLAKALEDRMRISAPTFIQDWEERLAFMGEQVQIIENEKPIYHGGVSGLDAGGKLILQLADGSQTTITIGEIHLRPLVDR